MASAVLSVTLDNTLATQLDALVSITNRGSQYHLQRALEQYLETKIDCLRELDEGIADAEAGRLTDLETVRVQWQACKL